MLQPFDYKDPSENKRHKFLVQSVILKETIPDDEIEPFVSLKFYIFFYTIYFYIEDKICESPIFMKVLDHVYFTSQNEY